MLRILKTRWIAAALAGALAIAAAVPVAAAPIDWTASAVSDWLKSWFAWGGLDDERARGASEAEPPVIEDPEAQVIPLGLEGMDALDENEGEVAPQWDPDG